MRAPAYMLLPRLSLPSCAVLFFKKSSHTGAFSVDSLPDSLTSHSVYYEPFLLSGLAVPRWKDLASKGPSSNDDNFSLSFFSSLTFLDENVRRVEQSITMRKRFWLKWKDEGRDGDGRRAGTQLNCTLSFSPPLNLCPSNTHCSCLSPKAI